MPGHTELSRFGGVGSSEGSPLSSMSGLTTAPLLPFAPQLEGSSATGSDSEGSNLSEALAAKTQGRGTDDSEQDEKISLAEAMSSIKRVAAPFFREGGKRCWILAISNLIFLAAETSMMIKISDLNKSVQNALTEKQQEVFWACMLSFCWWILVLLGCVFLNMFAAGAFTLEWRKFLTDRLLLSYINDKQAYYRLKMQRADIDNPDQRIGQDLGGFTGSVVPLFSQLARAVMTIVSMSVVLYFVSAKLFAVLIVGSVLMSFVSVGVFGGPLMRMQRTILAREASLRFTLVRVREHAESIAFYRGASFERDRCMETFGKVIEVCYRRLFVSTTFHGFQICVTVFLHFLPALVMAPEYFDGKVGFGSIGQASMLFNQLMHSMTLLASQLEAISNLGAQAVRVRQLQEGLLEGKRMNDDCCAPYEDETFEIEFPRPKAIELQEMPRQRPAAARPVGAARQGRATSSSSAGAGEGDEILLRLSGVTLLPPRSPDPLVSGLSLALREGQALMIAGPSGAGKSSLLRAIGGLWANGHGTIERCHMQDCFFAPQVPYLCMGTLRENSCYPHSEQYQPSPESDELIKRALAGANVAYLADRHGLDNVVNWDDVLSGGEKQRVGFARLLLRTGVRLALLDEATSAMDPENEDMAYSRLQDHVPCFASVGHRPNLEKFHTHKLTLRPLRTGGCEGELREL